MRDHNEHYWDVDRNRPVVHGDMQKVGEIKAFHTPAGTAYTAPVVDPLPGGTELYAVVDWKVRAGAAEARLREIEKKEAFDYITAIHAAQKIVESKPTWKRFIDGTPLSNDIAVWMANFARDYASPVASDQDVQDAEIARLLDLIRYAHIQLEAVLCDVDGVVCIDGSDGDIRIAQEALDTLKSAIDAAMKEGK